MSIARSISAEGSQDESGRHTVRDSESSAHRDEHPDSQDQRRIDVQSRQAFKSEDYRLLFHLPPDEVLVQDFNCALQKKILLQGHMYLFEGYVCFYSNIFGYEKKVIPLKDVTFVRKAKTAGMFPNAIEITAWGKKDFFASFLSRDEAYRLLIENWSHHSAYAKLYLQPDFSPSASPDGHRDCSASSSDRFTYSSLTCHLETNSDRQNEKTSSPLDEAFSATVKERLENEILARDKYLETQSLNEPSHLATPTGIWHIQDGSAPELPENFKKIVEYEFPIGEEQFFQLFFSDEAIEFVEMFHKRCGDEDFNCTKWVKHHHLGHVRDISFRHPINLYFGPKASYCQEVQCFKVYSNRHVVIETSQQLADVPYGDYFKVEVRWDVQRLLTRPTPFCSVQISLDVAFSKTTIWRSKIIQGTLEESKEAYSTWIREALALLEQVGVLHKKDQILDADLGRLETVKVKALPSTVNCNPETVPVTNGEEVEEKSEDFIEDVKQFQMLRHSPAEQHESEELATKLSSAPTPEASYARKHIRSVGENNARIIRAETKTDDEYENYPPAIPNIIKFQANRKNASCDVLKVVLIIFAITIFVLQIGIVVILTQAPSTGKLVQMSGSHAREELKWLEQRAYLVKEEIMKSESRLQSLQQDISSLKMRFHLFEQLYPQINFNQQNVSFNTVPN